MLTAAILANGAFPANPLALERLRSCPCVVCCDGALLGALANKIRVGAVVGDGDSLPDELKKCYAAIWRHDPGQDDNDLAKALRHVCSNPPVAEDVEDEGYSDPGLDVDIFGAAGKREDHFIGNLFQMLDFATDRIRLNLWTDTGVFTTVCPPDGEIKCSAGRAVSIFAPDPETEMTSEGLEWPLAGVKFDKLWRATLNRAVDWNIKLTTNRPVVVYREF